AIVLRLNSAASLFHGLNKKVSPLLLQTRQRCRGPLRQDARQLLFTLVDVPQLQAANRRAVVGVAHYLETLDLLIQDRLRRYEPVGRNDTRVWQVQLR